jgi:hypothetical protein
MTSDPFTFFDQFADKTVSDNDKTKKAYVVNRAQFDVLVAAQAQFHEGGSHTAPSLVLSVLNSTERTTVEASFYGSLREGSGRNLEARMGREFISTWLQPGDKLRLGRIGSRLFALKLNEEAHPELVSRQLAAALPGDLLFARASAQPTLPAVVKATTTRYARNPLIVAAALKRAAGQCERPSCAGPLFLRDDGSVFLEVHHVVPLAEQGLDTITNVAALCPGCHREAHHGAHRLALRQELLARIAGSDVTGTAA